MDHALVYGAASTHINPTLVPYTWYKDKGRTVSGVGKRIREIREGRGLTLDALAAKCGIAKPNRHGLGFGLVSGNAVPKGIHCFDLEDAGTLACVPVSSKQAVCFDFGHFWLVVF